MFSWMEVLGQWKQGILYPRWAQLPHWGYGEARFIFYPPASWMLGAALGAVLPWKLVPGAYIWIVLTLAGCSMFRLAREWLPRSDALFAAALYAVNPYHLVIVYWRSAYAELLASALLPLLVVSVLRLGTGKWRPVLWLGLTLAAVWLTNAPAAMLVHYSLAAFLIVKAAVDRSSKPFLQGASAVILGAGLGIFYLLPASYEQKWVNIAEVLAPGVRPQDNFLFTRIDDPDHNRFNLFVSFIAIAEIAMAAVALWLSRKWRAQRPLQWLLLATWVGFASLLMFSITNLLWQYLPKLRFVQLPWRWLLCLNAAQILLLTMAIRRWSIRALASAALLGVVVLAGYLIQPPWWDTAVDIQEMTTAMTRGTGNEGTDEYVPAGADPYELDKKLPLVSVDSGKSIPTDGMKWGAAEKRFAVQTSDPQMLVLRLFNYPAWEVKVNGNRVPAQSTDVTGQMMIPVPKGKSEVTVRFRRTPDRAAGGVISLLFLIILGVAWRLTRSRQGETDAGAWQLL